jgi:hypothetical protein
VIFTELLVLFLVIGSSTAIAYTGFSEENNSSDIHKNTITQIANPLEVKFLPLNPAFIKYRDAQQSDITPAPPTRHSTGYGPSPIDLSYLTNFSKPKQAVSAVSLPVSYDLRTLGGERPNAYRYLLYIWSPRIPRIISYAKRKRLFFRTEYEKSSFFELLRWF